jgi:transcriptional regulator with XRE-family HTH domain
LTAPPRSPPNRIRELREARGFTLDDLAVRVGTTNQQISHLELGKRQLTVAWLRRLGAALGCHPWAIVEGES